MTSRRLPQQKDHTELDAVRDYIARIGRETGYERKHLLWLPVLRDKIYLSEFSDFTKESFTANRSWPKPDNSLDLSVIVGEMDDPENQTQMPFQLDFAVDGNVAICGSIVTGKSTALQTIAYELIQKYSPEEVNLYAIDFSSSMMSCFETAPHCGGVMYENDTEQIGKFFNMMNTILEDRKRILHGGNYKQYVQVNGVTMPAIFLMIDNYGAFKQKTGEAFEQDVIRLSREGISNGIYLLVTGGGYGANDITSRVGENIGTVLTLSLKDRYEYSTLLHATQISVLPETGVKGRGLAYYGNRILEYQTAVAVEADNDYERMEKIKAVCDEMAAAWTGRRARKVPQIPEKPFWDEFRQLEEYEIMNARPDRLPIGYDQANAAVYGIPLDETFCYGIYGARQSGRSNLMKVCALAAIDKGADVCVIDSAEQPLGMFAGRDDVTYCLGDRETYEYFTQKMHVFQERGRRKRELAAQGLESDEIYKTMAAEFRPLVILLPDLDQFITMIHRSEYEMSSFLVNVFSRGQNSNIYFIGDLAVNKRSDVGGYPAFEAFISGRSGIHLGGNLTSNTILNFDYLSFSEQNKADKPGIGSIPDVTDENATRKVVIPVVRRTDAATGES